MNTFYSQESFEAAPVQQPQAKAVQSTFQPIKIDESLLLNQQAKELPESAAGLPLEGLKKTGANTWTACCPTHDDENPSLSIRVFGKTRINFHCFAGCERSDIKDHFKELEWSDAEIIAALLGGDAGAASVLASQAAPDVQARIRIVEVFKQAKPLAKTDGGFLYLTQTRGREVPENSGLRYLERVCYDFEAKVFYPAIIAPVVDANGNLRQIH